MSHVVDFDVERYSDLASSYLAEGDQTHLGRINSFYASELSDLAREIRHLCDGPKYNSESAHFMSCHMAAMDLLYLKHQRPELNSLVDLGSGSGFISAFATMIGYDVVGVEKNYRMLREAKDNFETMGLDPNRLAMADFLDDEFPTYDLHGRVLEDFDVWYAFLPWSIERAFVGWHSHELRKDALLVTGMEGKFMPGELQKHYDNSGIYLHVSDEYDTMMRWVFTKKD